MAGLNWFKVKFFSIKDVEYVLNHRPWYVASQIFTLRRWEPTFHPATSIIDQLLVWVRFPFLSFHYWNEKGIKGLANDIGVFERLDDDFMDRN